MRQSTRDKIAAFHAAMDRIASPADADMGHIAALIETLPRTHRNAAYEALLNDNADVRVIQHDNALHSRR